MAAELERTIRDRDHLRARAEELRRHHHELGVKVVRAAHRLETEKLAYGKAVANFELGEPADVAAAKATYTALTVEAEALEVALCDVAGRVKEADDAARKAERAAARLAIEEHKHIAAGLEARALVAFEEAACYLGQRHAHAHCAEELAGLLGRAGEQPIPYDGVHASLSRAPGDGGGILGVMRKHGIAANFTPIRTLLPRVGPLVVKVWRAPPDDELTDDPGVVLTTEASDPADR
jgi:hypothetical protein